MKLKLLRYIFGNLIFTLIFLFILKENLVIGIIGLLMFGGLMVLYIIKYFNPKFKYISDAYFVEKDKMKSDTDFNAVYNDLGIFDFYAEGFSYTLNDKIVKYNWSQIKTLIGYKVDQYTADSICLDVFLEDMETSFSIHEATPGWYQFNIKLSEHIKTVSSNWQMEIAIPAFDPKPTVLFDSMQRSWIEVEEEYYKKK